MYFEWEFFSCMVVTYNEKTVELCLQIIVNIDILLKYFVYEIKRYFLMIFLSCY